MGAVSSRFLYDTVRMATRQGTFAKPIECTMPRVSISVNVILGDDDVSTQVQRLLRWGG